MSNSHNTITDILGHRVLLLDGSMGVILQRMQLNEAAMRGRRFISHAYPLAGNFDVLNLSRPDIIASVHRRYLESGADIIETNTFNSNALSQRRYGCEELVFEFNLAGARIARAEADAFTATNPSKPRFVAGSMGPTGVAASLSADVSDPSARQVTFEELAKAYELQARALTEGGVDFILVETIFDLINAKAAVYGIRRAAEACGIDIPYVLSVTISDSTGRILSGHTMEAFVATMAQYNPMAVGFNCSAGPGSLAQHVRNLATYSPFPIIFYPNAGLPDELGNYSGDIHTFSSTIAPLLEEGVVDIVGGCCGTSPGHIAGLSTLLQYNSMVPAHVATKPIGWLASTESFFDGRGFINVGERCNVAGSRKFLRLVKEKNYDEAVAIARQQVKAGAMIIDINFDDGMLDAPTEMTHFLRLLSSDPVTAAVPWMIDSSDFRVIEAALQNVAGKAIVNSISLKHGDDEMLRQARIIRSYGAAAVVMLFDEQGQATTFDRKIEIASRAVNLLTKKGGFVPEDIIIDPNVLTIATGMPEHDAYALDFIRAVEWIHRNLPGVKTSGGISNLSFAFRGNNYLRQAMHAVFLYHAVKAGLSMAILDPTIKVAYTDIPDELLALLEDAVLMRRPDAAERLIARAADFTGETQKVTPDGVVPADISVEERLMYALRVGDDTSLEADLNEAVAQCGSANAVVEGSLMKGMEEVGRLFEEGKMFLPQVVKSARIMHMAVNILTPMMNATTDSTASKGTFLLATVKGDVHDIGKNIVKVVLECNNFRVIDLGVQVEASEIVAAAKTHHPDFIGLSGLIAPSLAEMAYVASQLEKNGLTMPLFVGGAATSDLHTALKIAPEYPSGVVARLRDAARNPVLANRFLSDPVTTKNEILANQHQLCSDYALSVMRKDEQKHLRPYTVDWTKQKITVPSFMGSRVFEEIGVGELYDYINWIYFYNCWKVKPGTPESDEIRHEAEALLRRLSDRGASMRCVVSFYPANSDGNGIVVHANEDVEIPTPRQHFSDKRTHDFSLSDFVAPTGMTDFIGCFCVTIGDMLRHELDEVENADSFRHLLLSSLCDRLAEACSEFLHAQVRRRLWGYAADEQLSVAEMLRARYSGIRPAVGYPSLPDQKLMHTLARLVPLCDVGVKVTENGALSPASSVAGFYIASPEAIYFSV